MSSRASEAEVFKISCLKIWWHFTGGKYRVSGQRATLARMVRGSSWDVSPRGRVEVLALVVSLLKPTSSPGEVKVCHQDGVFGVCGRCSACSGSKHHHTEWKHSIPRWRSTYFFVLMSSVNNNSDFYFNGAGSSWSIQGLVQHAVDQQRAALSSATSYTDAKALGTLFCYQARHSYHHKELIIAMPRRG